jgi:phospholipid/cholesterol/gamma-HCH transport system ATP-binding protein
MQPGIEIENATFRHGDRVVLQATTLSVAQGGCAVVTGANGSGKSTLLYACAGLLQLSKGRVLLAGRRADPTHPSELLRRGVRRGFVFQEGGLLSNMNALANVSLSLRYHADVLGLSLRDVEERARAALRRVRVSESELYSLPAHLSFGVRKRVSLARAIALDPNFFFFDDPDVGLDPDTAALVHEILCGYRDDPNVTMLVATNRDLLIDRLKVTGYTLESGQLFERRKIQC